jgi:uncharacterized protein YhaN
MRFDELHLLKYGNFEGCDLAFPRQPIDFHVIFGANEAGKSTTLAAVGDLLFGFPHGITQAYRFDASLLRVGAVLEQGTQRLQVRRKRGRGASLMDVEDNSVDEALLTGMLQGQTRETFHAAWSLDHRLLREGGQAIVTAKNDIGQALFAAGSGLIGVTRILQTLEEEGDQIWGPRAKASRSYSRVSNELKDAEKRLRAAEVRPAAWSTAHNQLLELEKQQKELDEQQQVLTAEQRTVERARRVLEPVEQLHTLRASLAEQTSPLLTPAMEALFETTFALHAEAVLQQDVAERLLEEQQKHLDAIVLDEPCILREDEIQALVEERGIRQGAADGLPLRQASLQQKKLELQQSLLTLHLPEAPAATLLLTLAPRATVAELKRLLQDRTALDSSLKTLRDSHADATGERDASARALADHDFVETATELQEVVEAARRLGDPDGQAEQALKLHQQNEAEAADAFARLMPWSGDAESLRRLAVPPEDTLRAARDREFATAATLTEETQEEDRLREQAAARALERELLLKSGTGVSAASVAEARLSRDGCWNEIRAHIEGKRILSSPRTEADRFEGLTAEADRRADERFLSAEVSGRLAQADAAVATAELHLAQATARVQLASAAQQQAIAQWSAELTARSLPVATVIRLREWLVLRDEAVEKSSRTKASAAVLLAAQSALDNARQTLVSAIGQPVTKTGANSFRKLLDQAESALKTALDSTTTFTQLKQELRKAEDKVLQESRKIDRNLAEAMTWRETWKQAIEKAHLNATVSAAELDTVELVRNTATSVDELEREIEMTSRTQKEFLARTETLWVALGMPTSPVEFAERIELMRRRLQTAREDSQRVATMTAALHTREQEHRTAEAKRKAAESSLAPLLELAGVQELPALSHKVEESKRVRKVLGQIHDLTHTILSLGDGFSLATLFQEVEGKTPDELARRSDELARDMDKIGKQIRDAADLAGVSRTNFQALDHGASASEAAADAEMARAEMDVQAEAYLLKRTESLLLRWAVERKRKQTQNPLLVRASRLFSVLTGNRYSSLSVYDDGSSSVLLGNCADDSRPVPVGNMSEGTIDQLFLALRVASIEQSVKGGSVLPVLADDLFINFDNQRAEAGFRVLGELAKSTQVLFFTHHQHLLEIARKSLHPHETRVCNL